MGGLGGQQFFRGTDRFEIRRRLGAGGFGVVYEAYDRKRNAPVALKTLLNVDVDALYRFKKEFRSLADISHPNLVTLYELVSLGEDFFFTMELVPGINILDYARRRTTPLEGESSDYSADPTEEVHPTGELHATATSDSWTAGAAGRIAAPASPSLQPDLRRVRHTFAQLAEGVCALHEAAILHRDIKPSNVLVTGEERVVLLDFGLVAEMFPADRPQSITVAGTPAYMSPEQSLGRPLSEASDWYSVGVVLYEALTGRVPFRGSFVDVVLSKQQSEAPLPSAVAPNVPPDLDSLCRDLLRRDAEARPSGREVLGRLGASAQPAAAVTSSPAAGRRTLLVGRERHLAALADAFHASQAGRAVTVCVSGQSGMGKSTLVRHFLHDLRQKQKDLVGLSGRCYERESVPYKALDSLIDALGQYLKRTPQVAERVMPRDALALARLFPVLREVEAVAGARRRVLEIPDSQELRRRAFGAFRELLTRLADLVPLVLFIDDLQWGDLDSGALLAEVLQGPDPPALLLIVCYRSEEAASSPLLANLLPSWKAAADVREVVAGELSDAEVRELVLALLGRNEPEAMARAEAIARESGGSPFFVDELLRYATTRGQEESRADRSAASLDRVIHARVSQLPEPARRFLEVVAVAGQPLKIEVARAACGLSAEEQGVLNVLRGGHLVRTRGAPEPEEVHTYHDRIRESVLAHLPAETRIEHHRRLALAFESREGADAETLAVHFQEAGEFTRAAEYAARAAERAAEALAFDRAARLYRLALELRPASGAEGRRLQARLGDALAKAGRGAEAAKAYLAAAEVAPATEALELQRRAGEQLLFSGHVDECLPVLRSVLGTLGMKLPATPRKALLSLLLGRARARWRGLAFRGRPASEFPAQQLVSIDACWSVTCGLSMVDVIRGAEFSVRHLLLALEAGEPYRVVRAICMEAGYCSASGGHSWPRTQRLLQTSQQLAERIGDPHAIALTTMVRGTASFLAGRFQDAFDCHQRAEATFREKCTGVAWEMDSSQIFLVDSLFWLGRWEEMARRIPVLLKEAQERGDLYFRASGTRRLHMAYLSADEPENARVETLRCTESWSRQGFQMPRFFELIAQSEIDLYEAKAGAAWERIHDCWPSLTWSLLLRVQFLLIEARYLRARAALALAAESSRANKQEEAARFLKQAEADAQRIEREKIEWGTALAGLLQAGVAAARGQAESAVALLSAAEQGFEKVGVVAHAAVARRRRGEILGGQEGKRLVDECDAWMATQKVKNPERMVALFAPGRWSS